jgi:hypothetical protein
MKAIHITGDIRFKLNNTGIKVWTDGIVDAVTDKAKVDKAKIAERIARHNVGGNVYECAIWEVANVFGGMTDGKSPLACPTIMIADNELFDSINGEFTKNTKPAEPNFFNIESSVRVQLTPDAMLLYRNTALKRMNVTLTKENMGRSPIGLPQNEVEMPFVKFMTLFGSKINIANRIKRDFPLENGFIILSDHSLSKSCGDKDFEKLKTCTLASKGEVRDYGHQ